MDTSVVQSRTETREFMPAPDRYRATLLAELASRRRALARCTAALDELAQSSDRDAISARKLMTYGQTQALEAVDDIEWALRRLDDGTYGLCARCRRPIGEARLEVLPCTLHCVDCASTGARPG